MTMRMRSSDVSYLFNCDLCGAETELEGLWFMTDGGGRSSRAFDGAGSCPRCGQEYECHHSVVKIVLTVEQKNLLLQAKPKE